MSCGTLLAHCLPLPSGTYLTNSAQAEEFCIQTEEGVAKGIRRIVALTGAQAKEALANADAMRAKVKETGSKTEVAKLEAATTNLMTATLLLLAAQQLLSKSSEPCVGLILLPRCGRRS